MQSSSLRLAAYELPHGARTGGHSLRVVWTVDAHHDAAGLLRRESSFNWLLLSGGSTSERPEARAERNESLALRGRDHQPATARFRVRLSRAHAVWRRGNRLRR